MSNVRILNENYVDANLLVSQTNSSAIASAPATNVQDKIRRTKVWRSAGHWEITSLNNKIIFRDAAGVDKTATIAIADYSTDATFLAAVDAAFEATGAANYTVTRDTSSNKIKITSDLSGGATIFQLMWTDILSTAASILGFSILANDTGASTYTADLLKIHTSEWIKWDLGTASNPQAFVMLGKRNYALGLSSTAVIKLQGNSTDVWTAPAYNQTLTWSETGVSIFDDDGLHTSALRYWRLIIEDFDNPNGYIEISNIYLGEAYEPTQGAPEFPFDFEFQDLSKNDESDFGLVFTDIRQQTMEMSLRWNNLTLVEVEILKAFVENYGTFYPFFISLDPDEVFSSDLNQWVKLVRFKDGPKFTLESPNLFSSTWELREDL
jgi:hypothetical protein